MKLGGRELAGVGFAIGLERVVAMLQALGRDQALMQPPPPMVWLVALGDDALAQNLALMQTLRAAGVVCRMAPGGSLKSQMRAANKAGAAWTVIRGVDELAQGVAAVKNMASGEQRSVPLDQLADALSVR
jgi:histidyl-tRNA synthetase